MRALRSTASPARAPPAYCHLTASGSACTLRCICRSCLRRPASMACSSLWRLYSRTGLRQRAVFGQSNKARAGRSQYPEPSRLGPFCALFLVRPVHRHLESSCSPSQNLDSAVSPSLSLASPPVMDHCAKIATGMIMIREDDDRFGEGHDRPRPGPGPGPVLGPCEPAARVKRLWVVPSLKLLS